MRSGPCVSALLADIEDRDDSEFAEDKLVIQCFDSMTAAQILLPPHPQKKEAAYDMNDAIYATAGATSNADSTHFSIASD